MFARLPHARDPRRRWSTLVLLLALVPASCSTPPPPPKPAEPPPEAVAPPPRPVRPILHAAWSFQTGPDACVAVAKAGPASLQVAVRRAGLIRLTVSLPGGAPRRPVARFAGPAGRWLISGSNPVHREALFTLERNDASLSRILILLSGGTLNLEPPGEDFPILSLPETGAEGQQWFTCVRRIVNWT